MTRRSYSLECLVPPLQGTDAIEDFTSRATEVKVINRLFGGNWMLEFKLPLRSTNNRVSARNERAYLRNWFDNRLGFGVVQKSGGQNAWRGVVWEMELSLQGEITRKSFETLYNAVKVQYVNSEGNAVETAWQTDDGSIARYGRSELKLGRVEFDSSSAPAVAASQLTFLKNPRSESRAFGEESEYLRVTCVGTVWMLNRLYSDDGDDSSVTISAYISELAQDHIDAHATTSITGGGYFTIGRVDTNSTTTVKRYQQEQGYWDHINRLTEVGDGSNNLYVSGVDANGVFYYRQADNTPRFEYRGRTEGIVTVLGSSNPWLVRPGVVRSKVRTGRALPSGSFLQQTNDTWVLETTMSDGQEQPTFEFGTVDELDLFTAQRRNETYIERASDDD